MNPFAQRLGFYSKKTVAFGQIADQWINFTIKAAEYWTVNPSLLDKLKLPLDITIQTDEMQTSFCAIVDQVET